MESNHSPNKTGLSRSWTCSVKLQQQHSSPAPCAWPMMAATRPFQQVAQAAPPFRHTHEHCCPLVVGCLWTPHMMAHTVHLWLCCLVHLWIQTTHFPMPAWCVDEVCDGVVVHEVWCIGGRHTMRSMHTPTNNPTHRVASNNPPCKCPPCKYHPCQQNSCHRKKSQSRYRPLNSTCCACKRRKKRGGLVWDWHPLPVQGAQYEQAPRAAHTATATTAAPQPHTERHTTGMVECDRVLWVCVCDVCMSCHQSNMQHNHGIAQWCEQGDARCTW